MPKLGDSFTLNSTKPNFERDHFDTLAEMKAYTVCDNGHLSFCEETKCRYEYQEDNTLDDIIGKWRLFTNSVAQQGSSTDADTEASQFGVNQDGLIDDLFPDTVGTVGVIGDPTTAKYKVYVAIGNYVTKAGTKFSPCLIAAGSCVSFDSGQVIGTVTSIYTTTSGEEKTSTSTLAKHPSYVPENSAVAISTIGSDIATITSVVIEIEGSCSGSDWAWVVTTDKDKISLTV